MKKCDYMIVGGGMTADAATKSIRSVDPNGSICMYCEEPHLPYKRPALSKKLWQGKPLDFIKLKTDERNVDIHTGQSIVDLNIESHCVTDSSGETTEYRKLLLATGGYPRRLSFGDSDIIYYRTLDDYLRLRELCEKKDNFAVIGGGFIGSEIAASLNSIGKHVSIIMPENEICSRLFPKDLAEYINSYYEKKGVEILSGQICVELNREGDKLILRTESNNTVVVDGIVAGVGMRPNVSLAQNAGLAVGDGIVTGADLTAGHPDVYAAGDCASFVSPVTGLLTRVEHEDNALKMGKAAGLAMAGEDARYEYLPMFYSDMFELGYEAVGQLDSNLEVFADWQEEYVTGVLYYMHEGRVLGVLLWNVWDKTDEAREIMLSPGPFTRNDLKGRIKA